MPWLRPDGKTQVTVEYKKEGGAMIPVRVHTLLISTQHNEEVTNDQIHKVQTSENELGFTSCAAHPAEASMGCMCARPSYDGAVGAACMPLQRTACAAA